jgi:hypothetical protein
MVCILTVVACALVSSASLCETCQEFSFVIMLRIVALSLVYSCVVVFVHCLCSGPLFKEYNNV